MGASENIVFLAPSHGHVKPWDSDDTAKLMKPRRQRVWQRVWQLREQLEPTPLMWLKQCHKPPI